MSLKDTDVKTPGNKAIAKKWKLSSSEVNKLVKQGANHEKEHNTNIEKAKQVARDHIGERPDYYKMLDKADKMDKNKLKEDIINELSNKLMKKYMKRAKGELNARDYVTRSGGDYQKKPDLFQHGPAWPGDHEVTDQYAKIHKRQRGMERATALMNIREVKTYGRVSRPGWKPSKDSTNPASPGEPKGDAMKNAFDRIEKAFPKGSIKVGGRKDVKEESEPVDYDRAMAAFRRKETGSYEGNYASAGHKGRSASGAYQFVDKTWRGVTKRQGVGTEYKHASDAPREVQDKVMRGELENNVKKYGSLEKAVNVHYTGNPMGRMSAKAAAANAGQGASKYYSDFSKHMAGYNPPKPQDDTPKPTSAPQPTQTASAPESSPKPTQVASAEPKQAETPKIPLVQPQTKSEPGSGASSFVKKQLAMNEIANTPKGQSTLVKYVRGAAKDLHNTGLIHGYDSAANPRPNGGETETRKNMKRNAKNRTVGIERAVKRMNPGLKEEQMDINEISSKLATRYYDKADKDLPKQKKNSRKLHNRQTGIQRAMKRGIEDDYIKRTGYNEETTMEKQDMVAEAINNILEGNLENMRQNLFDVLQETAIEKLEERKKEIASNYFAQD